MTITSVSLIATHPVPPITLEYAQRRNAQLQHLAYAVRQIKHPVIVMGDLNVSPWSSHYKAFVERSSLVSTRDGIGILPTWPSSLLALRIPIDHCLVTPEFGVHSASVANNIGSDHLPYLASIYLR